MNIHFIHSTKPWLITSAIFLLATLTACGGGGSGTDSGSSDTTQFNAAKIAEGCDACHVLPEIDGTPVPQIDGMSADYFVHLLKVIANGERLSRNAEMGTQSQQLFLDFTEEEVLKLGEFYSSRFLQPLQQQAIDSAKALEGENLHSENCNDCHSNGGRDISNGILAGQRLEFLKLALEDFADSSIKTNDVPLSMVQRLSDMTPEDREAIAHYYASQSAEIDTQKPTDISNLELLSQSTLSIKLDWNKSTDNWGIRYYIIKRNGAQVGLSSLTKFIDNSLDSGQVEYIYDIIAVDTAGNQSTAVSITVQHDGGGSGSNGTGAALYAIDCAACHGEDPANGDNNIANGITADVIQNAQPAAFHDSITANNAAFIAAYIEGALGNTTAPPPPPPPVNPPVDLAGKALYEAQCTSCHGSDPSQNILKAANGITLAGIRVEHNSTFVSDSDGELIAEYIADIINGGDGTFTPPAGNQAGKDIYDSQCILCHGSNPTNGLRNINRGTDASIITAEHSFVTPADAITVALYIKEIVDPGNTGGNTDTPLTGQELYVLHCVSCHGANPADGLLNVDKSTTAVAITNKHPGLISQDAQEENTLAQLISDYIVGVLNGNGGGSGNSNGGISEIGETSATFTVIQDVYIKEVDGVTNDNELYADISSNNQEIRGMLQWDTNGLPLNTVITSASIAVNIINTSDGVGGPYQFTKSKFDWSEANVDFAKADKTGDQLTTFVPSSLGTLIIPLNPTGVALVQSWIDGGVNNGIVLSSTGTSDGVHFDSHEAGNGAVLSIQYGGTGGGSTPPPTPPPAPDPDIAAGKILYDAQCSGCHNKNPGPNNIRRKINRGVVASKTTIEHSFVSTADAEIIATYLQSVFP